MKPMILFSLVILGLPILVTLISAWLETRRAKTASALKPAAAPSTSLPFEELMAVRANRPRTLLESRLTTAPSGTAEDLLVQIASQAVSNAEMYSSADEIGIELRTEGEGTLLTVSDDGVGFDTSDSAPSNCGLALLQAKAEDLGGTIVLMSQKGVGTAVSAWIPNKCEAVPS